MDTGLNDIDRKIRHREWLEGISKEYEEMISFIEREHEHFRIYGLSYAARGDIRIFNINPHRTIPYTFILNGLKAALKDVNKEIAELKRELSRKPDVSELETLLWAIKTIKENCSPAIDRVKDLNSLYEKLAQKQTKE